MDYKEQIKDPRWQKKRLEILQRDNFKCKKCENDKSQLHVHHIYYLKDCHYWEYPNDLLITLCCNCHEDETYFNTIVSTSFRLLKFISDISNKSFFEISDLLENIEYLVGGLNYKEKEAYKIIISELLKDKL